MRVPRGMSVRPTAARVRTSIFSILGERVEGAMVLDLFAGSGAFGIEALSRGAKFCCFVEYLPAAIGAIKENLKLTGFEEKCRIRKRDVFSAPALGYILRDAPYDLVFLDPPYGCFLNPSNFLGVVEELGESGYLADDGLVILQHPEAVTLPAAIGPLRCRGLRKYGKTMVTFLSKQRAVDNAPEST